jgi:hypothetical protein
MGPANIVALIRRLYEHGLLPCPCKAFIEREWADEKGAHTLRPPSPFALGLSDKGGYPMAKQVVTVRLPHADVEALDQLTVGQFSRSQVMRIVLQDFLERSEKEQKKFLTSKAFD